MTPASVDLARIGIALDGTLLTAAWRAPQWRTMVVPCDGTALSIQSALREVAAQVPACRDVTVTLLRPLATARTVTLPGMRSAEVARVLGRDWARYVIGLRAEPHHTSVRAAAERGAWRAAFAPVTTLEALAAGAREHGWTLRDVRTTDDALATAAHDVMPTVARIDDAIVVLCSATGATDVAHLRRGVPTSGRQLVSDAATEIGDFARRAMGGTPPASATVIVVGDEVRGAALARELGGAGLRAQFMPIAGLTSAAPAAVLAASALLHPAALPLVAPSERAVRLQRARIQSALLAATTVALIAGGFVIENHRLGAALDDVARQRSAIAPQVNDAVTRRARLESATDAASTLAAHESGASHASAAVAAITLALPDNASLTALQITGDSVTIEGESDRSADVYAALRATPVLEAVRLASPLRQERQADDTPVEHFAFSARLKSAPR